MANVNCYPTPNIVKPDQPVNSQYIQKILDENVGLIHAIIDKQQQNQEAEELLKSLHKNLIYLATIADQTTSAGNAATTTPAQPQPYNYSPAPVNHPPHFPGNIQPQPNQSLPYVTQSTVVVPTTASTEIAEKKPLPLNEESYKDVNVKPELVPSVNVDMDRDLDKAYPIRDTSLSAMSHKNVDIDKECSIPPVPDVQKDIATSTQSGISVEYTPKFEENVPTTTAPPHVQNTNIKTDMPPPSQPIGIHQDKASSMQYQGNHRIMYPGVAPNYNQYNPHFDQNSKFYPQNMYQQSPYNYQGMYNHPYQPVAPPATQTHYNQHLMNSPMYQQYPYYQQPGAIEQMPPIPKDSSLPPQMHPGNTLSQPMYPPNTMQQSMYSTQNPLPPVMHPPNTMSQSIKPPSSDVQSNTNITE